MSEFYVGYLPKAPAGIARRIRMAVGLLFALAVIGALTFACLQRTYAPAVFEYGKERNFEGGIEARPFPTLIVKRPNSPNSGSSRYLLVAEGKHGADREIAEFDGKTVRLRGTLIYRGNQTMIELVSGSLSVTGQSDKAPSVPKSLGTFDLSGEIVDGKCFLGVMNPGNGKVHRDCAALCLSGGIPPLFATNDLRGAPAILLLTNSNGQPLRKAAFLDRIGQPVRIKGTVLDKGDTLVFEADPSTITVLR